MTKKPSSDLASSLLASFDALEKKQVAEKSSSDNAKPTKNAKNASKRTNKPHTERLKPSASSDKLRGQHPVDAAKNGQKLKPIAATSGAAMRSTITYHGSDSAMADEIIEVLKSYVGVRATFSEAVRIALALCPKTPEEIVRVWGEKREEDGRVLRHRDKN